MNPSVASIEYRDTAFVPVFLIVKFLCVLFPTVCIPNEMLEGEAASIFEVAFFPVPDSPTVLVPWVALVALDLMDTKAL